MLGVPWQEEINRGRKGPTRGPHSLIGIFMYDAYCIICEKKLWPPKSLTFWTSPSLKQLTGPDKV